MSTQTIDHEWKKQNTYPPPPKKKQNKKNLKTKQLTRKQVDMDYHTPAHPLRRLDYTHFLDKSKMAPRWRMDIVPSV